MPSKSPKPAPDSTGLVRNHELLDGGLLHATLVGFPVSLVPDWITQFTKAPGSMSRASLAIDLMDVLEISPETYQPAQKFVREYGKNLVYEWGQCLFIKGGNDPVARRILAAGVMNEILRIYHFRADVSVSWAIPRSFENLYVGYDAAKQSALFTTLTRAKLVVFDNLNVSMHDSARQVEEVISLRLSHNLPSVFVMNESPSFSEDIAFELSAEHHQRAIFQKTAR
jgi:hypothetical protein